MFSRKENYMEKGGINSNGLFALARVFILINAAIWLSFAIYTVFGGHPSYTGTSVLRWVFAAGAAAVAAGLILLAVLLGKKVRWAFHLSLIALFGVALVTLFDQMGLIDIAVFLAALAPAVLLLLCHRWYFLQTV